MRKTIFKICEMQVSSVFHKQGIGGEEDQEDFTTTCMWNTEWEPALPTCKSELDYM